LTAMSRLVAETMQMPVQANKAIVGSNAFAHSSGIHQDGFLKDAQTYEIIDPSDVGAEGSKIVLTARSGRAALAHRYHQLGYPLSKDQLNSLYPAFLELADAERDVQDAGLLELTERFKLATAAV